MNTDEVVNAPLTVSDKIRKLDDAGYPRAEIARLLNKRYQHVRNVLEGDRLRQEGKRTTRSAGKPRPTTAPWSTGAGTFRLIVDSHGDLTVPRDLMDLIGARPGDALIASTHDQQIVLMTSRASLRQARDLVRSVVPDGISLVDDLIADRRQEVALDTTGG